MTSADLMAVTEQATVVGGLHCSAAEVAEMSLTGQDFLIRTAGQVWDALLSMEQPSLILLAHSHIELLVDAQRWTGLYLLAYGNSGALRANAGIVRRESRKRQAIQGHVDAINKLSAGDPWAEYEEE